MADLIKEAMRAARSPAWRLPVLLGAAALASSFWAIRANTRRAEQENPPAGRFIDVDGVRLHYVERGGGPCLVLLHGNGATVNDFEASGLLERAAKRYRVIAFDRPGYGYSERPRRKMWTPFAQAKLLRAALRQLDVEQPIVLGHSWGTLVALGLALEYPAYVRGLVLLSGYYFPSIRFDVALLSPPAIPVLGDLMRYTVSPWIGRMLWPAFVKRMFSPSDVPDRFRRLPAWMMLRPGQLRASAAESAMMIPSAMTLQRMLDQIQTPLVLIAGAEDRMVDAEHSSVQLHHALPHSELRLQPGVGHMVHYAVPDAILDAIFELDRQTAKPNPAHGIPPAPRAGPGEAPGPLH